MTTLELLFSFRGRIGRTPYVVAMLATAVVFAAGIYLSEASLPAMAAILAPRGINAAFALNGIWLVLGALAVWSALALTAKRLHDRGRSGWWGAAVILPLVALALLNDALFLVSKSFVMPAAQQYAILVVVGALGAWLLYETVALPGGPD